MAKSIIQGIVDDLKPKVEPKPVVVTPVSPDLMLESLPESKSIEDDMEWAYQNIGIENPDWSTAPSKSCKFMWEYARTARSEFLGKYIAIRAKAKDNEKKFETDKLDTIKRMSVIDAILDKLPTMTQQSLEEQEFVTIMGVDP